MQKKILIVEDDLGIVALYTACLASMAVQVTVATNGEIALKKMEGNSFDLILLDMQMPGMNGMEFLMVASNQFQHLPPIIVCSSLSQKDIIADALKLGASDYLTKPVENNQLRDTVSSFLKLTGDKKTEPGGLENSTSIMQLNTAMVLSKRSAVVQVSTSFGSGELTYDLGKLKHIAYNGKTGMDALDQLKKVFLTKVNIQ